MGAGGETNGPRERARKMDGSEPAEDTESHTAQKVGRQPTQFSFFTSNTITTERPKFKGKTTNLHESNQTRPSQKFGRNFVTR